MGLAARRPAVVAVPLVALALLGGMWALTLNTSAGTDNLVGSRSATATATDRSRERFGEDPIYVLVRGALPRLVLTSDINRLIGLEGCLSGNIPSGVVPPGGVGGPCARLAALDAVKFVFGPGTFINTSVNEIGTQFSNQLQSAQKAGKAAAAAARKVALAQGRTATQAKTLAEAARQAALQQYLLRLGTLAAKYNLSTDSLPTLNDPTFVAALVFADTGATATPKRRFAYLFPSSTSALVQVRLRSGLSEAQRRHATQLIRDAVAMPEWKPQFGGSYLVTGAPVLVSDLTDVITDQLILLLIGAVMVMALTLGIVFRAPLRLLPLAVALSATAVTFGGVALAGASLTMASVGVLPILIGLAVDYVVQLQARVLEERGRGSTRRTFRQAATVAAQSGVPTIAIAAAATAAGFLALLVSPVPMVRQFGIVLVAGTLVAVLMALALGTAALVGLGDTHRRPGARVRRLGAAFAAAWRGAGELLTAIGPLRRAWAKAVRGVRATILVAMARPGRVVGVAVVLALAGWGAETQMRVESNLEKLVPQNIPAVSALSALQESTGVAGEVDVLVEGDNVTSPAVVRWMGDYQRRMLARYGYSEQRGCRQAELCPGFSLSSLFTSEKVSSQNQVDALLDAVPAYFSQGVLTPDRHAATLAFGLKVGSLDRQLEVLEGMRRALHPPAGVTARLAGLPVLVVEANDKLASVGRRFLALLLGLLLVGAVLLMALRSPRRALLPLVPIVLATGWSALVLVIIRIPLNPMSVALGSLVIAIATEFSVLLSERYRRERLAGHDHGRALRRTYRSTGTVVVASGVTAIAGFAVLMLSDIAMLRDFGAVTVVDLAVALAGVLIVLPAVLTLAERRTAARGAPAAPPDDEPAPEGAPAAVAASRP